MPNPTPGASKTEKLMAYFAAALEANKLDGVTVQRARSRPSTAEELPFVTLRPFKEKVTSATRSRSPMVDRMLTVVVTVRCEGEDTELDPYRTNVIATMMADQTAGGLAIEVSESEHQWTQQDAVEASYIEDVILFDVRYPTSRSTPEV